MREKIKRLREKISNKISSSSTDKKMVKKRDKLAGCVKNAFLAFVNAIGPVWNFLFLKSQDPDESDLRSNEIRKGVIEKLLASSLNFEQRYE